MAEFYFDSKIQVLKNELKLLEDKNSLPQLYFERDYSNENVQYIMYMTFPQWDANDKPIKDRQAQHVTNALFTQASIYYDICAIGVDSVVNVTSKKQAEANNVEVIKEIDFKKYSSDGHRCIITRDEGNCSGVGKIILRNGSRETVYFFAVNFEFKKKIRYSINGDTIRFEPSNYSKEFRIVISSSGEHGQAIYPCLKGQIQESTNGAYVQKVVIDNQAFTATLPSELHGKPIYVSFDYKDEEANNHYMLECVSNSTLGIKNTETARQDEKAFCPYCHSAIRSKVDLISKSKHGGVGCDGKRFSIDGKKFLTVVEGRNYKKVAKDAFYCSKDFTEDGNFLKMPDDAGDLLRTLPENFFEHKHFKIIVVGSKRAGKTTFISRLFGIRGSGEDTELHADMIRHGTRKIADLSSYSINSLKVVNDATGKTIVATKDSWYKKNHEFYASYSIDINKGIYPGATNTVGNAQDVDKTQDITKTPFIMEVNKNSYIYFYDMAGEDAQRRTDFIKTLVGDSEDKQPVAIFCLIDSRAEKNETLSVFNRVNEALKDRKSVCPVAVILTKFDTVEKEFDDNCYCLRSDSYDLMSKSYEGSDLERCVNFSSEEIRSYLSSKEINPDFSEYANVKYFGVSAFSTQYSIFHRDQRGVEEEVNYLRHSSSPKRMELPIIWTLKQFGCII